MGTSAVSAQGGQPRTLRERISLRVRSRWHGSATQLLWSRLEYVASLHDLCLRKDPLPEGDKDILAQCDEKLELARRCIDKKSQRWSFAFWSVIHEVDGLLLLVLPEEMLLPRALEIQQRFEAKVRDPVQRRLWLGEDGKSGPLPQAVQSLTGTSRALNASPPWRERLLQCRHVLRGALEQVNIRVDKSFWQLSINVTIQIFSTVLLMAFFAAAFAFSRSLVEGWRDMLVPWALLFFTLAGAAGATVSNMLSKERFVVATGATSRYFIYYLLVKPAIGAFAALLLVLLEQSRMLLAVVVSPRASVPPMLWSPPVTIPYLPEAPPIVPPAAPALGPGAEGPTTALVQIVVDSEPAAFFALAALAVAVGFSADRMLSSMMDRVLGRLWTQSEKLNASPPETAERPPLTS